MYFLIHPWGWISWYIPGDGFPDTSLGMDLWRENDRTLCLALGWPQKFPSALKNIPRDGPTDKKILVGNVKRVYITDPGGTWVYIIYPVYIIHPDIYPSIYYRSEYILQIRGHLGLLAELEVGGRLPCQSTLAAAIVSTTSFSFKKFTFCCFLLGLFFLFFFQSTIAGRKNLFVVVCLDLFFSRLFGSRHFQLLQQRKFLFQTFSFLLLFVKFAC